MKKINFNKAYFFSYQNYTTLIRNFGGKSCRHIVDKNVTGVLDPHYVELMKNEKREQRKKRNPMIHVPCHLLHLLLVRRIKDLVKRNMSFEDIWQRKNLSKSDLIQYQKNLSFVTKSKNTYGDQRMIGPDSLLQSEGLE